MRVKVLIWSSCSSLLVDGTDTLGLVQLLRGNISLSIYDGSAVRCFFPSLFSAVPADLSLENDSFAMLPAKVIYSPSRTQKPFTDLCRPLPWSSARMPVAAIRRNLRGCPARLPESAQPPRVAPDGSEQAHAAPGIFMFHLYITILWVSYRCHGITGFSRARLWSTNEYKTPI